MKTYMLTGILPVLSVLCVEIHGQTIIDTAGIYGERRDSLEATVVVGRQEGNYLSKGKDIRTEVITAAGLCKMACCNLAESFENSASVSVGYSDAVTGARQIRLLGQSGVYTQMLDENRPVMRGLSAPWGLNYVPGQWLESIQIAKGSTSVINGVESMTGQINMEHRKPTDEKPLYVQASFMNDTKADLNVVSSLQFDELSTWSTVILAHVDGNFKAMDHNGDGFMDDPRQLNIALSNRWLYFGQDGVQVRFGVRAIRDDRIGGQMENTGWRSNILNRSINGYVKVGVPVSEDGNRSVALVSDYTYQNLASNFDWRRYNAGQHSAFVNLMYQDISSDNHHFTLGFSEMFDAYSENVLGSFVNSRLNDLGLYGEYTYHDGDRFSAIVGLRGDWYNGPGLRFTPRVTLKWSPVESLVFRANGGRGLRYSNPILDNIGVMSTNKAIVGNCFEHTLEDSWTAGANLTWYLPFDEDRKTYLSVDYFHTSFTEQLLYENSAAMLPVINFYKLSSLDGGYSRTENVQVDLSSEPFRGFTFTLTGRFTDARQTLACQSDDIKPMTSRYKAVLNLQYATRLNKWIFDFTASLNGPCRVWDFMKGYNGMYMDGYTPSYPLLYAQVTKRFKGFDIYFGGENLTGYTQPDPIISASDAESPYFDASCIWGPLMGVKIYGGIRLTIWKTE
ncbi:MAG: TonB-dependent receptor [Bacteroidales bacterium]|nr:TonB-dependent receptor [Bacteroidales bacterium]